MDSARRGEDRTAPDNSMTPSRGGPALSVLRWAFDLDSPVCCRPSIREIGRAKRFTQVSNRLIKDSVGLFYAARCTAAG